MNGDSLSVRFLNEALAERGTNLRVKLMNIGPVLLVEDDDNDALLVKLLFNLTDVKLDHVTNGRLAIEAIEKKRYALVLLDMRLPDMSGIEVLKHARRTSPQVHVVILTGSLTPRLEDEVREVGYFGVCLKPLTKSNILDILLTHRMVEIAV